MEPLRLRLLLWLLLYAGVALRPAVGTAQDGPLTPEAYVARGDQLLEEGRPAEAGEAYRQALQRSEGLPGAQVGLARVALAQADWQAAGDWVNAVLAQDPEHLEAHYLRGIVHRELAKYRTINQAHHWSEAERDFAYVLGRDSLYRDALYQFALLRRYHGSYADAITLGMRQVQLKPQLEEAQHGLLRFYRAFIANTEPEESLAWLRAHPSDHAAYFVGEVLRRRGELQEADAAFVRLLTRRIALPTQPVLLSRARIYYALGDPAKAEAFVMQAIQAVAQPLDAALLLDDFKYIITDKELEAYRALRTPEEYRAFFNGFWVQRDPTPAGPVNVRLAEHYRRLLKAEQDYAFDGFRLWHNNPDRLGELAYPQAYHLNEEFNDKGLIYIRHGEPDDREAYVGGDDGLQTVRGDVDPYYSPIEHSYQSGWRPNESWRYNRPRMDFHFVIADGASGNNWRLTPTLTNLGMLENLEHWGAPYTEMASAARAMQAIQGSKMEAGLPERANALDEQMELERIREQDSLGLASRERLDVTLLSQHNRAVLEFSTLQRQMAEQSREVVMRGLTTDRHTWAEDVEPLQMPHLFAAFRGEDGKTLVEVHFALPIGQITQQVGADAGTVDVRLGYAVHDQAWQTVSEKLDTKRLPTTPDPSAAVIDFFQFTVPPDSYSVSLYSEPVRTAQLGGYKVGYRAPDYAKQGLAMSDLLLAESIVPAAAPSRFNKRDLHISPNPFGRFSTGQPVFLYFEVYDLAFGSDDQTRFTVEYTLTPEEPRRRRLGLFGGGDRPALTLRTERSGTERSPAEYAEIDVRRVDPGPYTLTVRITDEVTGTTVTRTRPIELFRLE